MRVNEISENAAEWLTNEINYRREPVVKGAAPGECGLFWLGVVVVGVKVGGAIV